MATFDPTAIGEALTGFMKTHPYTPDDSWTGDPSNRPWWINPDNNADQSAAYQPFINANGYNLQFQPSRNANLARWTMADPEGNHDIYYQFDPQQDGTWKGSQQKVSHNYLDHFTDAIGDVTPAITTALIAFITGGAASGAMGSAGAAGGVGATEGGGGMAGAGTASGGIGETAGGFSSLPAGGMGATGVGSLGAGGTAGADYGALGSGMYGTGDTAMGSLFGTSGSGAFPMGSGMSGVTSADLAASGSGFDWASQARKIAQQLMNNNQPAGMTGVGGGGGMGPMGNPATQSQQNNYQSPDLMPKFSISAGAPVPPDELTNSANIRMIAQRLRGNNGF